MTTCAEEIFCVLAGLVLMTFTQAFGQCAKPARCRDVTGGKVSDVACGARGIERAEDFPGADMGAKISAALAACPPDGCRVELPAGEYSLSTSVVVDKPVWIVGAGAAATRLRYVGTSDAFVVEAGGSLPFLAGGLRGFGLVGTSAARAGVHQVDTIGFTYEDIAVGNFTGAGAAGIWMDNEAPAYCANCGSGFSERTAFRRLSVFHNRVGVLWTSISGVGSFEYTLMRGVHFQVGDGEVGMLLRGGVALQHSDIEFMANVWDPGTGATLVQLRNGARWYQGRVMVAAEQTAGKAGVGFSVDETSYFDGEGAIILGGLPNRIARGGFYRVGVYGPTTIFSAKSGNPAGASAYPLNVDGSTVPGASGLGDVLLAAAGAGDGALNESMALGGYAAGLGVDIGSRVQHPLSWSHVGDPVAFAWYPKLNGATPISGKPGAWLASGAAWAFFADRFSTKGTGAAQTGALALADGDIIAWRNHAGTGDVALGKDTSDRLLWDGHRLALVGRAPDVYSAGRELHSPHVVIGVVGLVAGRAAVELGGVERFSGKDTYVCTASDRTTVGPVRVANISRRSFLILGSARDRIGYQCIGN